MLQDFIFGVLDDADPMGENWNDIMDWDRNNTE